MIEAQKLRDTGEYLLAQDRLRLLMHKHPDGDVFGSTLGLAHWLRKEGKNVAVFGPYDLSPKFDFLPGFNEIQSGLEEARNPKFEETLYLVVDSTGVDRTGFAEGDFQRVLRLDHHIDGSQYDPRDLVDTSYAATTLLISDLLREMAETAVDADIATCLLTGLITDTGGFRYSSTDAHAFSTASFLVERGASPSQIATMIYDRRDPAYLTLMQRALESLSFHDDGRVALLVLKPDGLPAKALPLFGEDDFINLPRSLAGVEVVIQLKRSLEGDWKVGFRGKGKINVQAIAASFGGGGHFSASGCELMGEEADIRQSVLERTVLAVKEALD
jgi:phosphoesterase RecJ-like protein